MLCEPPVGTDRADTLLIALQQRARAGGRRTLARNRHRLRRVAGSSISWFSQRLLDTHLLALMVAGSRGGGGGLLDGLEDEVSRGLGL